MTEVPLSVRGLDVVIDAHRILDGVALEAGAGRFVGIIGPNGSGKSTLIRCMSRALAPLAGSIRLGGTDIALYGRRDLALALSVVPQEAYRTYDFSVEDVVAMGRYAHQPFLSSISKTDREACRRAMATAGVSNLADRRITTLSGGEWQRVLIARTLAQESGIVLLDEPTSHLDASQQILVLEAFQSLVRDGTTVVGVFHDLNLAAHYCDEILVLSEGRVAASGPPRDVITRNVLRDVFELETTVGLHPYTGRPVVLPLYAPSASAGAGTRVHVVCGGGSGGWLLPALVAAGCAVSVGVLSMNDSDHAAAQHLGVPCIAEPPFSPVSPASSAALREAVRGSDLVLLTPMPVGPGNVENLRVLDACDLPVPISLVRLPGSRGADEGIADFTGGEATALVDQLLRSGRMKRVSPAVVLRDCARPSGGAA